MIKTMFSEFEEVKKNITQGTFEDHPELVNLSQDYLNELSNMYVLLHTISQNPKKSQSTIHPGVLLAFSCIIKTCYSIYSLVIGGLYREATSMLRMIMEDFETLLFIHYYPDQFKEWMVGKIPQKEILKAINKKLRSMGIKSVKSKLWNPYSITSKYVHSTSRSMREVINDGDIIAINLGPAYNELFCEQALFRLCDLSNFVLKILLHLFDSELDNIGYSQTQLKVIESRFDEYGKDTWVKL